MHEPNRTDGLVGNRGGPPRATGRRAPVAIVAGLSAALWAWSCSSTGDQPRPAPSPAAMSQSVSAAEESEPVPRGLVVGTEPWTFGTRQGKTVTMPSYRLFTTVQWPWMLESMPDFLEASLRVYTSALGTLPRPGRPMDTYLMDNRQQWLELCRSVLGPDDRSFEQIQKGAVTLGGKAMLYNVGARDTFALVAHEGWHQYSQSVLRDPLPVWLEEGIATYMEGLRLNRQRTRSEFQPWRNFERFEALRRADDRGELLTLEELFNTTPQDELARSDRRALTYYAQIWALVHFLREGEGGKYSQGLAEALADAARSGLTHHLQRELGATAARSHMLRRRGPQVFQAYCSADLAMASAEYRRFVSQIVEPGAGQFISQGASPVNRAAGR